MHVMKTGMPAPNQQVRKSDRGGGGEQGKVIH